MIDKLTNAEALYFVPLGGAEQFGVNLNVYMHQGRMLAIDCGIGFADERFPGIDLLLPDPALLEKNADRLEGLVITHAHEDHIGAVAYLYSRLKCPLYAAPFTAEILERKLDEHGVKHADVRRIDLGDTLSSGPFELSFLPVAHSIPDACAVLIQAGEVKALHSGDWNLDPAPVAGGKTERVVFERFCKGGVDAYIGDSTNAGVPGRAGSESEIEPGLAEEFAKFKSRIFVTTFSSNIGRLVSILRAAKRVERKVCFIGRSLHRMLAAAVTCGFIEDGADIIDAEALDGVADEDVVIVCTGSQGENRAALSRMARADHPAVKMKSSDVVIFSARTIPGNEMAINAVKNDLISAGVRVISPRDTASTIHVSGHPCQDEILELWSWVKPNAVIPVHGELEQLDSHAALARSVQVPHVVVPSNGSVIEITASGAEVVDHVETGLLAVDQKRLIQANHRSISARRKLQYTGFACISLALNPKGRVVGDVFLETVGLIDDRDEDELKLEDKLYDKIFTVLEGMKAQDLKDDELVADRIRIAVRRFANKLLGLRPKTLVHVIRVK